MIEVVEELLVTIVEGPKWKIIREVGNDSRDKKCFSFRVLGNALQGSHLNRQRVLQEPLRGLPILH